MPGKSDDHQHHPVRPDRSGERIAKAIARAGLASRREAEAWIAAGRVAVNGQVITTPAVKVAVSDAVTVDGKPLPTRERTRLYLFHKPRGLVTTRSDPEGRPTIFDALPKELPRLISVGRLDLSTEGLLLLTNDGGLAWVLELPDTGWLRRYRVRAHGSVTQPQLDALSEGVSIDGIRYGPIEATLDRVQGSNVWLRFAIREGKNREVRNVLEHLGLKVNRLIRVSFGPFQLRDLAEGAVEEVPTRVLREQLGRKLAERAGCDFTAPMAERKTTTPARKPSPRHFEERAQHAVKNNAEQNRKPRPWHGRARERPVDDRAADSEAPRETKSGLITDRRGRRVLVQRSRSEAPERPERTAPSHRGRGKPPRDRRKGPRPSRPKRPRDKPRRDRD